MSKLAFITLVAALAAPDSSRGAAQDVSPPEPEVGASAEHSPHLGVRSVLAAYASGAKTNDCGELVHVDARVARLDGSPDPRLSQKERATHAADAAQRSPESLRKIELFEVLPRVACARVDWTHTVEYVALTFDGGCWLVRHVLSQVAPERGERTSATPAEIEELERAGREYVDGLQLGRPELVQRALHADCARFAFDGDGPSALFEGAASTRAELEELAARVEPGAAPAKALAIVEIVDRAGDAALLEIASERGIDYAVFARLDGRWQAVQVVGQSHPLETAVVLPTLRPEDAANERCPLTGGPLAPDALCLYRGVVVGFCSRACRDDFTVDPLYFVEESESLRSLLGSPATR